MVDIRPVVTSFLRFQNKILLLQRSSKVGTYQGKWGGCSGYIEKNENPDFRAITEIQEETKLEETQIKLIKKGTPLEIIDEQMGITWIVHPYLFEIATDQIQLDWEHKNYMWIAPEEINKFKTVPNLKETYDRIKNT
ncbi:MAG TPA: NUDIX domain-containing protein [Candidatus Deferrimicrobium sp.]|nr:NUDIX domain-containing protein [Candidatus Deferrimicrobium sp.]